MIMIMIRSCQTKGDRKQQHTENVMRFNKQEASAHLCAELRVILFFSSFTLVQLSFQILLTLIKLALFVSVASRVCSGAFICASKTKTLNHRARFEVWHTLKDAKLLLGLASICSSISTAHLKFCWTANYTAKHKWAQTQMTRTGRVSGGCQAFIGCPLSRGHVSWPNTGWSADSCCAQNIKYLQGEWGETKLTSLW